MARGRSLAATHRKLSARWHPTKNGDLTARDVTAGSEKRIWWKCPKGPDHEWNSRVTDAAKLVQACPFCTGQRTSVTNCLSTKRPDLAAQWHPTKNGNRTARDVRAGSKKRTWWQCAKGADHEWSSRADQVAKQVYACPFCTGARLSITNCLLTKRPDLAARWHRTKNGDLTPRDVTAGSEKRIWWKCPKGPDHEWHSRVRDAAELVQACPFCTGQRTSVTNCVSATRPDLAARWHPTKNGDLSPRDVTAASGKRVWWRCPEGPDHEWDSSVGKAAQLLEACPFCSGKRVSVTNCLATVKPDVAGRWHPTKNGDLTPRDVTLGSSKKQIWWKCPKGPDHEWSSRIDHAVSLVQACPFCAGRRVSVTNSLASHFPEIAAQWHATRNGKLTPEDVLAADARAVWWKCPLRHVWKAPVRERAVKKRGCHQCAIPGAGGRAPAHGP